MKRILIMALVLGTGIVVPAVDGTLLSPVPGPTGVLSPAGATTMKITAMSRNPKSPNELLALKADPSTSKLFISTNSGATWTLRADIPHYASDVAYDPQNPNTIYVLWATQTLPGTFNALLKSTDKGATFSELRLPSNYGTFHGRIAVHPANSKIILVGCAYWPDGFIGISDSRMTVLKTTDGGATWKAAKFGFLSFWGAEVRDIVIASKNPNIVYMCGYTHDDSTGKGYAQIYVSKNAGRAWKNITDLTLFADQTACMGDGAFGLAVHPNDANKAWVAFDFGVARTADAGVHWTPQVSPAFPYFQTTAIALDALNPMILYAGFERNSYKSTDGGLIWKAHSKNLMGKPCLKTLARGSQVHFATEAGIFRSVDGGLTWKKTL